MSNVTKILAQAIECGASDVHINVTMPPVLRKNTELIITDLPPVAREDAKQMVIDMIGPENIIETSRGIGMQNMDSSIAETYFKRYIDREEAIAWSSNPAKMDKLLVHKRLLSDKRQSDRITEQLEIESPVPLKEAHNKSR